MIDANSQTMCTFIWLYIRLDRVRRGTPWLPREEWQSKPSRA